MTTITLEGKEYQLDIEQAEKLGLLKEKDSRVKSWEEFKEKYFGEHGFFYSPSEEIALRTLTPISISDQLTPHEATAIAAFSQLLKLRRDWIGEWEPDWETTSTNKYVIEYIENRIRTYTQRTYARSLSFPTAQMAREFLNIFRDLIEEAKTLI
jgi:hypothetical protein